MRKLPYDPLKDLAPVGMVAVILQLMFELMPSALPFVRAGKLRAFAVTSARRSSVVPELPTVADREMGTRGQGRQAAASGLSRP